MIPFLDLKAANAPYHDQIVAALLRVERSGRYVLGYEVDAFEAEWASYCATRHCVTVGNGLEALTLILRGLGIAAGDEVIVPANTYIATWLAVSEAGAVPVPVDADPVSMNIDPARVEDAIRPRTRAILAVHLYGRPAPMAELAAIARRHGIALLADAAQGHGIKDGLAVASGWSFYPTKNLGALGDAGAVTTNDTALADRIRRLRNYGRLQLADKTHTLRGRNSRMDELQAAVLRMKLSHLDCCNAERWRRAVRYDDLLFAAPGVTRPGLALGHVWHQYVIRRPQRDRLRGALMRANVGTDIHYPVPPHLDAAYADLGYRRGDFPVAEALADSMISLPIGYDVNVDAVARHVVQACAALADEREPAHA